MGNPNSSNDAQQLPHYSSLGSSQSNSDNSESSQQLPPSYFSVSQPSAGNGDNPSEIGSGLEICSDSSLPLYFLGELLDAPPTSDVPAINIQESAITFSGKAVGNYRLYSRSNKAFPTERAQFFVGGDNVSGYIDLCLTSPHSVESITITLKGSIIVSGSPDGTYVFLKLPVTIWSRASGDPRQQPPSNSAKHFAGKLEGDCRFDFSFPFPTEIEIPGQRKTDPMQKVPTPHSYISKNVFANVQYELIVNIIHGLFRTSDRVQTIVQYLPRTLPGPASTLRQLAYQQRGRLSGPMGDPEGWHCVGQTTVYGRLTADRDVGVACTMYLANPLCYARGTIIPCFLKLHSSELQADALDMLSQTDVPVVRLVCRVSFYRSNGSAVSRKSSDIMEEVNAIQHAVWWKPTGIQRNQHDRYLEGEIHLAHFLQPTSIFHAFTVKYTVVLLSLQSPILKLRPPDQGPLLSQPVSIANFHGYGPIPTGFTPRVLDKQKEHMWGTRLLNSHFGFM